MEFWATLLGAAVGVPAGAIVQYLAQLGIDWAREQSQKDALASELEFNRTLLDEFSAELRQFRNAVNASAVNGYYGYFQLSNGLFVQATAMISSGHLYRWMDKETIRKIQRASRFLSVGTEQWLNGEVDKLREAYADDPAKVDRVRTINLLNHIETQLAQTSTDLQQAAQAVRAKKR
jgi:hypothetical protein